jgi:transposase
LSWLRLPGFTAGDPQLVYDEAGEIAEVVVNVRPASDAYPICCLAQKLVKNGSKVVRYRDRPIERAPTWLAVRRQRVKCHSCGKTLYQHVPHVEEDHRITERLRYDLALSACKRPFRDVVALHAVEETLVRRVFRKFANEKLLHYRYTAPRVLGIDENNILDGLRGVIVDVGSGKLLDMLPSRLQGDIRRGFMERMDDWGNVEVWCQDMARGYKTLAHELFPSAAVVVDKFHVLTKANFWLARVRVAETKHMPEAARKLLPGRMRLFDRHWDDMSSRDQDRLAEVLSYSERLKYAYTIKEQFYGVYDAADRAEAEARYKDWVKLASGSHRPDWKRLMTMVQVWREDIFSYFDHRYTSGKVERMNRNINDINSAGNGMDFQTLRAKALLRHGRVLEEVSMRHHVRSKPQMDPIFVEQ